LIVMQYDGHKNYASKFGTITLIGAWVKCDGIKIY